MAKKKLMIHDFYRMKKEGKPVHGLLLMIFPQLSLLKLQAWT
jgi:hypothetical protein